VIRSFRDPEAEKLFRDEFSKPYKAIERPARRRLTALDAAESLKDLNAIPGNHLEKLSGDREGQFSVRINAQYRICFVWTDEGPADVEIVDYH
jgi:proteic killer suppression protein